MNVLVGCEFSGTVRDAFLRRGHNAYSCDLKPCPKGKSRHFQFDVRVALKVFDWDLFIVHPECTHLTASGAAHWAVKRADGRQQRAIDFFKEMMDAPVPRICAENPVGVLSSAYRKPDQTFQPYHFGHLETKRACLWLKGLPLLKHTTDLEAETMALPANVRQRNHYLPPSADRAAQRSLTYPGVAEAMADQWGSL